jgi:hypothetical protein
VSLLPQTPPITEGFQVFSASQRQLPSDPRLFKA